MNQPNPEIRTCDDCGHIRHANSFKRCAECGHEACSSCLWESPETGELFCGDLLTLLDNTTRLVPNMGCVEPWWGSREDLALYTVRRLGGVIKELEDKLCSTESDS